MPHQNARLRQSLSLTCAIVLGACSSPGGGSAGKTAAQRVEPGTALTLPFAEVARDYGNIIEVFPCGRLAAKRLRGVERNGKGEITAATGSKGCAIELTGSHLMRAAAGRIEVADGVFHLSESPALIRGNLFIHATDKKTTMKVDTTTARLTIAGPTTTRLLARPEPSKPQQPARRASEPKPKPPAQSAKPAAPKPKPATPVPPSRKPSLPQMRLPGEEPLPLPGGSGG